MGKFSDEISNQHEDFIKKQHMFFVATAPLNKEGHVNLSPKGMDAFCVLSSTQVAYMDVIGSGNETSAHLLENSRITIMFCSFDGAPNILRLYGKGDTVLPNNDRWENLAKHFSILPSTRQIITATIHKVQTSCGFGVPLFNYNGERDFHQKWADNKGLDGLEAYKNEKNLISIDKLPTALAKIKQFEITI